MFQIRIYIIFSPSLMEISFTEGTVSYLPLTLVPSKMYVTIDNL